MNIYDFDNTIYSGDTNKDIIIFAMKKHPIKVIKSLYNGFITFKEYKKGNASFESVKEKLFSFLFQIDDLDNFIKLFIKKYKKKIKKWYINIKSENDVIISASYELWIIPFCKSLGIKYVMGTKTDENGKIIGKNCKGHEKVIRYNYTFPNKKVINSYSDSKSDEPILKLADTAFVIECNKIKKYNDNYKFKR